MDAHAHAGEAHAGASVGTNIAIWIGLVAITGLEVFLAYMALQPTLMLSLLVVLSVVKAGLIMSFSDESALLGQALLPVQVFNWRRLTVGCRIGCCR
jgi:cytochrome c oxidase subunit IV